MAKKRIDLVDVIRANLGCVAIIDNDNWELCKPPPPKEVLDGMSDDEYDEWCETGRVLVNSHATIVRRGGGYGSGNCYGGDILQALAEIVGIKVESV